MKRVPIKVAREVAKANGFRQVILCAWDGERTHVVTYGVSTDDCAQAAMDGNRIKASLGWSKDLRAEPSRVRAMKGHAKTIAELLEIGDQRLLASDGPVGNQEPDLTPEEWGQVYRACLAIVKL